MFSHYIEMALKEKSRNGYESGDFQNITSGNGFHPNGGDDYYESF